ncbi:hypothetical protein [Luteolibacter marinus]|uniref:hypothetical protein n=1 Tax=Luteolibacter marinus TaxID=2776705 RepID=UPI001866AB0D|nr:hypothetical protein [Luteolibacter marinus]
MSFLRRAFGRKKEAPGSGGEFTFNQRAKAFWDWFSTSAEEMRAVQNRGDGRQLQEVLSPKVNELLPGMAWVLGPGTGEGFHSFTLSGEGVMCRQILADQWLKRSPGVANWTFHASRQAAETLGHFTLNARDLTFRPIEFWVTPEIDEENEEVDLVLWHPLIEKSEDGLCMQALFLVLDEIFGEFGTSRWIGKIEFSKKRLAESMPIAELKDFVAETSAARGWKMRSPVDTWGSYSISPEKRNKGRHRLDTIAGTCGCWPVLSAYLRDPADFEDPFRELGASWIYLTVPTSSLPEDRLVESREEMAEIIHSSLAMGRHGIPLGGAIGEKSSYLDFLIFDGRRSIEIVQNAARKAGMPADTRLDFLDSRRQSLPLFE